MQKFLNQFKLFIPLGLVLLLFITFRYSGFLWADSALTHFGINGVDLFPKSGGWIPSRVIDGVLSAFFHNISYRFLHIFFGLDFFEAHAVITSFFYSVIIVWLGYLSASFFTPKKTSLSIYIVILCILIVSSLVKLEGYNMVFAYAFPLALLLYFLKRILPPESLDLTNSNDLYFKLNFHGFILLVVLYLVAFSIEHLICFAIIYFISYFVINFYKLGPIKFIDLLKKQKKRFSLILIYFSLSAYSLLIASNSKRIEVFKTSGSMDDDFFKHNYLNFLYDINIIEPLLISKAIIPLIFLGIILFTRELVNKRLKNNYLFFIFITLIMYSIFLIFVSQLGNRNFLIGLYLLPIFLVILSFSMYVINGIFSNQTFEPLKILLIFLLFLLSFHIINYHLKNDLEHHSFYLNYKKAFYKGLESCENGKNEIFVDFYLGTHPNEGYPLLPGKNADGSFRNAIRNIYLTYYGCKFDGDGPIFYGIKEYDGYGPLLNYR